MEYFWSYSFFGLLSLVVIGAVGGLIKAVYESLGFTGLSVLAVIAIAPALTGYILDELGVYAKIFGKCGEDEYL